MAGEERICCKVGRRMETRSKIGKSQALKVQRPASSGVKHIERQFRRRHRSYGLKVWGKNKAPLSSFEYSKPHEKV